MDAETQLASELATEVGCLLLDVRAECQARGDVDQLIRAEGDRRAEALIALRLGETFPDDPVLSEEARDDPRRLASDRVWIIDPLDGTREYAEGRSDWAVHVAFWREGALAAGAVALPGLSLTLTSASTPHPPPPDGGPPRMLVSRTRPPAFATTLAAALDAVLVPMGSAGAKAMAVVRGEADVYAHAGGQFEWDSAAPVAVAASAGLHTSRMDGSPLRYNRDDPWLPDVLICRPALADVVIAAARGIT